MKMTIVLDSDDPDGVADVAKMVRILQVRLNLQYGGSKEITRLKLIRIVQDYAKLIAFKQGHEDFKEVDYTRVRSVKEYVDDKWDTLD